MMVRATGTLWDMHKKRERNRCLPRHEPFSLRNIDAAFYELFRSPGEKLCIGSDSCLWAPKLESRFKPRRRNSPIFGYPYLGITSEYLVTHASRVWSEL